MSPLTCLGPCSAALVLIDVYVPARASPTTGREGGCSSFQQLRRNSTSTVEAIVCKCFLAHALSTWAARVMPAGTLSLGQRPCCRAWALCSLTSIAGQVRLHQ